MNSEEMNAQINDVKELAGELRQQLRVYQKCIRDPEATISLPDMDHICQLAEAINNKLDTLK